MIEQRGEDAGRDHEASEADRLDQVLGPVGHNRLHLVAPSAHRESRGSSATSQKTLTASFALVSFSKSSP